MTTTYVYWIKLKKHTDYSKQGYIGVSKQPEERIKQHVQKGDNPYLQRCFKKHKKNIEAIILFEFKSPKKAFEKEAELRPKENIGWNLCPGGNIPPKRKTGLNYKIYHNPKTEEIKFIPTKIKKAPVGWKRGYPDSFVFRGKKTCAKNWSVIEPDGTKHTIKNLTAWCKERGIPNLTSVGSSRDKKFQTWKSWRFRRL